MFLDQNNRTIVEIKGHKGMGDMRYPVYVKINDEKMFFEAVALRGELGLGETYSKGVWQCVHTTDVLMFVELLIRNAHILQRKKKYSKASTSKSDDASNISHHYDVGNDFYKAFLTDSLMGYTCAFWFSPKDTLETAQRNKVDTIIRKLEIKKGERVLDIGCGWGHIGNYIAEKTGAIVDGVTLSSEQEDYIKTNKSLNHVYKMHYLELPEDVKYDKIYCIGMIEHVRSANYEKYFDKFYRMLRPGGRFVLHTILNNPRHLDEASEAASLRGESVTFVTTHIFPGGQIPKYEWIINNATRKNKFLLAHSEGFGGQHYARTLMEWRRNLLEKKQEILQKGYSMDIIRAYDYYFAACEANFMLGGTYIGHFVLDKVHNLYESGNGFTNNYLM